MRKIVAVLLLGAVTLSAFDAESVYKKCVMCHGAKGEKVALNTSPQLNTFDEANLTARINGLLDGSSTVSKRYLGMHQAKLKGVREDDTGMLSKYILSLK